MKCCGCNKEIDTTKHLLVNDKAQWYGSYVNALCIRVICNECISDPNKKELYIK